MRTFLAAGFVILATPAFAQCEAMRPSTWGNETSALAAYAACLQAELANRSLQQSQLAQIEADQRLRLQLLQRQFEQQLELQRQLVQQQLALPRPQSFI